jgi:hypothetical protein
MLKWVWKLYQPMNAIWAKILRTKYPSADDMFVGPALSRSQFWRSIHKIKHFFKLGATHVVKDGNHTSFWSDIWVGQMPLKDRFPRLFSICYAHD